MQAPREGPSPAEIATEVGALSVGLGALTLQLFPFALPLLVLVLAPLALLGAAGLLLAGIVVAPFWLARGVLRRLRRGRRAAGSPGRARPDGRRTGSPRESTAAF
jgi:hypothetical protein